LYKAKHVSAQGLVEAVQALFISRNVQRFPVRITASVETNSVIVIGSEELVEEVSHLLEVLDQAQSKVQIEVLLLALPSDETRRQGDDLRKLSGPAGDVMTTIDQMTMDGEAKILNQFSLNAIENQPAMVQVGEQAPRITGAMTRPGREGARPFPPAVQTQTYNMGTMMQLTPKVSDDEQVLVQMQFEKSFAAPPESGVTITSDEEGEPIKSTGIITMTLKQNLRIESGYAEAFTASTSIGGERPLGVRYVLVVAVQL
jgi:type II secretory pathway component GspD/PulD (secretin)